MSLYEAGYWDTYTTYDYYTLDGISVDGYGDIDWTEKTYYDSLSYYPNYGYDYLLSDTPYSSGVFTDIYEYGTYYYDYSEWISHNPSSELFPQHGDWVLDAFINQIDSEVELILIDFDSSNGYMDSTQSDLLFLNIDNIIVDWLDKNNTATVNYLPIVVSASFGGTLPSVPESFFLDILTNSFAVIVQSVPNVTQSGFSWGDVYTDVINVGAYNVDANNNSLHGNPIDPSVIDILANGYIEHSGWGYGWNFGTSFSTPRVAAELTNLFKEVFDHINTQLQTGELTQDDLESSGEINYTEYIDSLLNAISSDVFVEMNDGWHPGSLKVLSDDIQLSPNPIQVAQLDVGLTGYHIVSAALEIPIETNSIDEVAPEAPELIVNVVAPQITMETLRLP